MSGLGILIQVGAQTAQAVKEIDNVTGALGRQMTASEKFNAGVKKAAVPAAAAMTAVAGAAMFSVKGAEEAAAANDKLAQVYESMGYSENAQAAMDYADALAAQVGIDDEIIKGAQTKLATFSEVAKSTETMGRATMIAADMQAAGFGSMESSSVMLGKALQDPVKGYGALAKVGVSFTDQQKEQIKAMVKAGDTAGAQAIIMGELEKQVGGVAEAGATSSEKMSVAFGEISEAVGAALLPAFDALAPKITAFAEWAANNSGILLGIGAAIAVVAGSILLINGALAAWSAVTTVWTVVQGIATAAQWAWNAAMAVGLGPILLVIAAIAALIAIGYLIVKNWDTIKEALGKAWDWIKETAVKVWDAIREFFVKTWDSITSTVAAVWDGIKTKISDAWEAIKTGVQTAIDAVKAVVETVMGGIRTAIETYLGLYKTAFTTVWDALSGIVSTALDAAKTVVDTVMGNIKTAISTATAAIKALFSGDFGALKEIVSTAIGNVLTLLKNLPADMVKAIGNLSNLLYGKGKELITGLIDGIKSMLGSVGKAVASILPGERSMPASGYASPMYTRAGGSVAGGRGSAVFNFYGGSATENAREVKRALENYDVSQGRGRGTALAVAW